MKIKLEVWIHARKLMCLWIRASATTTSPPYNDEYMNDISGLPTEYEWLADDPWPVGLVHGCDGQAVDAAPDTHEAEYYCYGRGES